MNRNNIWIHISLAVVMVVFAAVLGQMSRWQSSLREARLAEREALTNRQAPHPEVIVRFRPGVTSEQISAIIAAKNDSIVDRIESVAGLKVIDDLDDADAVSVAESYAAMTEIVEYAEVNEIIGLSIPPMGTILDSAVQSAVDLPNDPQFADQWALFNDGSNGGTERADIDALIAWNKTRGSSDVVVAVLDTGVDLKHSDLRENLWVRPNDVPQYIDNELGTIDDRYGYNGTDATADPSDDNGHGTHCAGIIGARGNNGIGIAGINWQVKLMPLKFLGRGGFGNTNDAVEAINYAIDRKRKGVNIRVISASFGSTMRSRALSDVIAAAGEEGILFVAAAGNSGTNNDRRPHYPSNYDLPNVISVAAVDRNDTLASFSNYGTKSVHIAAPGKDILSTWIGDRYREASGTSMATPYVSGVAALIAANEPNISVAELKKRILDSVDKIPTLDGKVATGGRLCAANALSSAATSHSH